MSEPEIIEMMYESLNYADRNFEFWISSSFAVILAFHFSAGNMSKLMYRLITFLYCSATVLFVSRWSVAALQYSSFRSQLLEIDASIQVSGAVMEGIITAAYIVVILLGSIGTVYFGYRTTRKADETP